MGYEKNQSEYIYFHPFFATYGLNLIGYCSNLVKK